MWVFVSSKAILESRLTEVIILHSTLVISTKGKMHSALCYFPFSVCLAARINSRYSKVLLLLTRLQQTTGYNKLAIKSHFIPYTLPLNCVA